MFEQISESEAAPLHLQPPLLTDVQTEPCAAAAAVPVAVSVLVVVAVVVIVCVVALKVWCLAAATQAVKNPRQNVQNPSVQHQIHRLTEALQQTLRSCLHQHYSGSVRLSCYYSYKATVR